MSKKDLVIIVLLVLVVWVLLRDRSGTPVALPSLPQQSGVEILPQQGVNAQNAIGVSPQQGANAQNAIGVSPQQGAIVDIVPEVGGSLPYSDHGLRTGDGRHLDPAFVKACADAQAQGRRTPQSCPSDAATLQGR